MSKAAKYGLGIYFTDSLDYSRYYAGEKNNREKLRRIPHIGDCHTFVQTEIYYDSSKKKHVYDSQYLVRYDDWLKNNNKADTQENYEMFRKECESKGKTVEKNGIHCGIVNTKTAILNENESKTESIVFNEYVVYDENQYLPMSAVTVERSEYLIIWRDPNFLKGGCGYVENYSEKFHNNLNVNKKFISAHSDCNVYCEQTTEEALELIRRKKCNKVILISNIGDDLGGKSLFEEARKILGSNVIVFFNASNEKHLNWIKDYPNALFSNKQELFEEFISNFNETGLRSLKKKFEAYYKVQLNEFDDDFLRYPYFINEGKYHSIKDIDNHEVVKQKTTQQIPKFVINLDEDDFLIETEENYEEEMKRKQNEIRKKREERTRKEEEELKTIRKEEENGQNREEEADGKQEEERLKKTKNIIDLKEMKQIEEWTGMEIRNVIFDSDFVAWSYNTSVFHQKIKYQKNLLFIIEDKKGNKFGGHLNAKITEENGSINDPKSFLFSLQSNGRLNRMMKFGIKDSEKIFQLNYNFGDDMFVIGDGDICIRKETSKKK